MASIFRKFTHKAIENLEINGEILDIGGEKNSDYHYLIKGKHKIITVNLASDVKPDFILNVEKEPLPFSGFRFDACLTLNLLEHLFDYNFTLKEARRVLKNQGILVCVAPFFLRVHFGPNDYFRFTKQCLREIFEKAGFKEISIKELGSGVFVVCFYLLQRFIPNFLNFFAEKIFFLAEKIVKIISEILRKKYSDMEYPLGYMVIAKK